MTEDDQGEESHPPLAIIFLSKILVYINVTPELSMLGKCSVNILLKQPLK